MSAVKSSLLTILLCSCGGAPFDAANAIPLLPEAGHETSTPEADAPEAGSLDAGSAPDIGLARCILPTPYGCGTEQSKPPYTYCAKQIAEPGSAWFTATVINPCNTCETYNCGCILYAAGCSYPNCNEDDGGHVFLTCGR